MAPAKVKKFSTPDEGLGFPLGRAEIVNIGTGRVPRMTGTAEVEGSS
jgi:hypothetical protein